MKITEASSEDIPVICALVNNAYRGDTSRKGWTTEADLFYGRRIDEEMLLQYFEDKDSAILKCTDAVQQITGCVYLKKKHTSLYLGMLTVSPAVQAKGIGKLLLKASEEKAKEKVCDSITISVITSRLELIAWYKRNGYVETGERQPFLPGQKFGVPKMPLELLVMQKRL